MTLTGATAPRAAKIPAGIYGVSFGSKYSQKNFVADPFTRIFKKVYCQLLAEDLK